MVLVEEGWGCDGGVVEWCWWRKGGGVMVG